MCVWLTVPYHTLKQYVSFCTCTVQSIVCLWLAMKNILFYWYSRCNKSWQVWIWFFHISRNLGSITIFLHYTGMQHTKLRCPRRCNTLKNKERTPIAFAIWFQPCVQRWPNPSQWKKKGWQLSCSPDQNPIENVWAWMKFKLRETSCINT